LPPVRRLAAGIGIATIVFGSLGGGVADAKTAKVYRAGEFCPKADVGHTIKTKTGALDCDAVKGYDRWVHPKRAPVAPVPTAPVTTSAPVPTTAVPVTAAPAASPPLTSSSGNLYRAGEICSAADLGLSTTASNGATILCETDGGYNRWLAS
jgi:hypothetical protein